MSAGQRPGMGANETKTETRPGAGAWPSAAPAVRREALHEPDGPGGLGRSAEFFDPLGPAWRLTAAKRTRLTPAVRAALDAGWATEQARWAPRTTKHWRGNSSGLRRD